MISFTIWYAKVSKQLPSNMYVKLFFGISFIIIVLVFFYFVILSYFEDKCQDKRIWKDAKCTIR